MQVLLKILFSLFLLLLVTVVAIAVLPDRHYQWAATELLEFVTDREVSVKGLQTNRGMITTIHLDTFELANLPDADKPHMAIVKDFSLSIDLAELLKGRLRLSDLLAGQLDVHLQKDAQGRANWEFEKFKKDPNEPIDLNLLAHLSLLNADLSNINVEYSKPDTATNLKLEIPQLRLATLPAKQRQELKAQGEINNLPFSIGGELGLVELLGQQKPLPFSLRSMLNKTQIELAGRLIPDLDALALQTQITGHSQSLKDFSVFVAKDLPDLGPIELNAQLSSELGQSDRQDFRVDNVHLTIKDPDVNLTMAGQLSGLGADGSGEIVADLMLKDLTKPLKILGIDKSWPGTLTAKATIQRANETLRLNLTEAILDSDILKANISGEVHDLLVKRQADFEFNASAPNFNLVTRLFDKPMPKQWGPITAKASLTGQQGRYALENIDARIEGRSHATVTGTVENILTLQGVDLNATAQLDSLAEVSVFSPKALPELGPLKATGLLTVADKKLALLNAKADYAGHYGTAKVQGEIKDLIHFDRVKFSADAKLPDLSVIAAFTDIKMPKFKSVQASGDFFSPVAKDLSIKNFTASYDDHGLIASVSGRVDSLIKNKGDLMLALDAELDSLSSLDTALEVDFPTLGPINANAKVTGQLIDIQLRELAAQIKDPAINGTITGDLGSLSDLSQAKLEANLNARSVAKLLKRFDVVTDIEKPASIKTQLSYNNSALRLHEAELELAGGTIIGDLNLHNYFDSSKRNKITGSINVINFDLIAVNKPESVKSESDARPVINNPKRSESSEVVTVEEVGAKKSSTDRFISNDPLPLHLIRENDLDLVLKVGRLRANVFDFENSSVPIKSQRGLFTFGPFKGTLGGGQALLKLDINAQTTPAITSFKAQIDGFDIAQTSVFRDSKTIESSGGAFARLILDGEGDSLASILASANGRGLFYFEDLLLKKGAIDLFTTDIFKRTFNAINPFKKKDKDTEIQCAALAFNITQGLLETPYGIAAEAKDYSMTGSGNVNLKQETVDLNFKTKLKKIFALNPLEKLTGLVRVRGDMTDPSVTLNPRGIFELSATIGAALATGGLSFIAQDQYEKFKAKSDLCAQALGPVRAAQ